MTAALQPRTRHVEHCMGTVFSIDIRDPGAWGDAVADVVGWLHHVDGVFSTYQDDSDISRIRRCELRIEDADPEIRTVLGLCAQVQLTTGGAFNVMPFGRLDPTGLVKGWAIERASGLLRSHGSDNHSINGGGDVQLAGEAAPGRPWTVGITDPFDRTAILTTVTGRDFAVATSGTSERGHHLLDPFTGRPATALASASVTGPSLTFADSYATAACVLGRDAVRWIDDVERYEALVVAADGSQHRSRGWRDALARPTDRAQP